MKALIFRCVDGNRPLEGRHYSSLVKNHPGLDINAELEKLNEIYGDQNIYVCNNAYILFRKHLENVSQLRRLELEKLGNRMEKPWMESLVLTDGFVSLDQEWKRRMEKLYPDLSIEKEVGKMRFWLEDYPDKVPDRATVNSFIKRWLERSAKNLKLTEIQNEEYDLRAMARDMNAWHERKKRNAG